MDLASLQTAFLTLDEAIKTTNRRVNALDNVVRPRLENTISYIKVRSCAADLGILSPFFSHCSSFFSISPLVQTIDMCSEHLRVESWCLASDVL